jgi:hypothetical protein
MKAVSTPIPTICTQPSRAGSNAQRQTAPHTISLPPCGVPANLRLSVKIVWAILPGPAAHSAEEALRFGFVWRSIRGSIGRLLVVLSVESTLQPSEPPNDDAVRDRHAQTAEDEAYDDNPED